MISGTIRCREAIIELEVCGFDQQHRPIETVVDTVVWHGKQKDVLITQADGTPLIGMALLAGNRLTMNVVDGGSLTIDELPET